MFTNNDNALLFKYDSETLRIEAWGPNALRIRATHESSFPSENWALTEAFPHSSPTVHIGEGEKAMASISNGKITASISHTGKITVTESEKGQILLEEFTRHRLDFTDPLASALNIAGREFIPRLGADSYHLTARFESLNENEQIYGMGQYQHPYLNLKGADLELAQRNSQASIPFALSSLGYGFLWNQPAVGRAVFGKNMTTFEALSTRVLDYWVVTGNTPADIVRAYAKITGTAPEMPEYGLGFWQCKLRYQTQEEVLKIAHEHKIKRKLPLDVLVVDFFHWPKQGDWKFDPQFWPDPGKPIQSFEFVSIAALI